MVKAAFLLAWLAGAWQLFPPYIKSMDSEQALINEVAESGRCADLSQDPDARVSERSMVAPGPPPVFSFRYYEGKLHHELDNTDLMLDDAGH
jgi:hypothetical protein